MYDQYFIITEIIYILELIFSSFHNIGLGSNKVLDSHVWLSVILMDIKTPDNQLQTMFSDSCFFVELTHIDTHTLHTSSTKQRHLCSVLYLNV